MGPNMYRIRHRLFFKLDHITLVNKDTGTVEAPQILPSPAGKGHAVPSAASPKRENTLSPSPADMPSVENPDFEAARAIIVRRRFSACRPDFSKMLTICRQRSHGSWFTTNGRVGLTEVCHQARSASVSFQSSPRFRRWISVTIDHIPGIRLTCGQLQMGGQSRKPTESLRQRAQDLDT